MPTILGEKQRELRQAQQLHMRDLEDAAKQRNADIARSAISTAGNIVGSIVTAGGRVAAAKASKDGQNALPKFSNRPIFTRQDPAWHGRFLAGESVESISFNYPAGFTRDNINLVSGLAIGYTRTPVQHVSYRYVPSVGAGQGFVANGSNTPSPVVETLQNDTATYGINQLWKATRSGNSGATNYDYAGMGVLIHGLRGFILHAHEIKKLLSVSQLNNKSSRGMASAIAYKSIKAYNPSSSVDVHAELEYIYSNRVEITAKYNKLMKKFNDFIVLPDEFNLFKRTSYIADGVFVMDRINATPITNDFYTEEFLLYTDGTFDGGTEGVRLVKKNNYSNVATHVIDVALYILELQLSNIILNQSFATMFGDIEKKLKEGIKDLGSIKLWHEDLLDPETVLVPSYDENILSMIVNLTLVGTPAWDTVWSGSELGIFEWDGRLIEGYKENGTASDANQQFRAPYLFLRYTSDTTHTDAKPAGIQTIRTDNLLINSLFNSESGAELLDHTSGTAYLRYDRWILGRNNTANPVTCTYLQASAAIASRVEIFCTMHVISVTVAESGTLAGLVTIRETSFREGNSVEAPTVSSTGAIAPFLDSMQALFQLEYKPMFGLTFNGPTTGTYPREILANLTRFGYLPLKLASSWAETDKMSLMAFGSYSESNAK